jgi:hypothetical protein
MQFNEGAKQSQRSSFQFTASFHSLHPPYQDRLAHVDLGGDPEYVELDVGAGRPGGVVAGDVMGMSCFVDVVDVGSLQPNQPGVLQVVVVTGGVCL